MFSTIDKVVCLPRSTSLMSSKFTSGKASENGFGSSVCDVFTTSHGMCCQAFNASRIRENITQALR